MQPNNSSLIGAVLADRFRIEKLIGEGGTGRVYLAQHLVLERPFALKVLHPQLMDDERIAKMFEREARVASRIEHPNVTFVYDFARLPDGGAFLVMEYVEGPTLGDLLQTNQAQKRVLELHRAFDITEQICEGVAAAHAAGVIHRDLKPVNVVLSSSAERTDLVKILDFGLAKVQDDRVGRSLTHDQIWGTPQFMSPEQCDTNSEVDHRSDIYSLGVLAFALFCGRLPFRGQNAVKLMFAHREEAPPRPSEVAKRTDLPPALDMLLWRCLAKAPDQRFQSAAELLTALREIGAKAIDARQAMVSRETETAGFSAAIERDAVGDDASQTATILGSSTIFDGSGATMKRREIRQSSAAIRELVTALRERNIGSPDLTLQLSLMLQAEDTELTIETDVDLLHEQGRKLRIRAAERQRRLERALALVEREGRRQAGDADRAAEFDSRAHELATQLNAVTLQRDDERRHWQERFDRRWKELQWARQDATASREEVLKRIRATVAGDVNAGPISSTMDSELLPLIAAVGL